MNKKLTFALRSCSSEQGFAIPVAVGMGLIMILISTTMIVRSQGDQVTASAQKATNRGLSAAETGITRYLSLINNNRAIATYKDCNGTRDANGACPDTNTTISWNKANNIPGSCSGGGDVTTITKNSTTAWQDVAPLNTATGYAGDPNKGQYRLVSYVYPAPGTTGTEGAAPGTGQLTVEGRVNQTDANNDGDDDDKDDTSVNTSTTQLQVNIPVRAGDINNVPVPGLWLKKGGMSGKQTVKGNIILNDCSLAISPTSYQATDKNGNPYIDSSTGNPYKTMQFGISFPDLPTKPNPMPNTLTINSKTSLEIPDTDNHKSSTKNGQPVYEYSINSIPKGSSITITPGKKVIFYLEGNIEKGSDIIHSCVNAEGNEISGCEDTDFQIFGYSSSGSACLNGNRRIDAFMFAPSYSVGVAGGGSGGGFYGSLWVDNFDSTCDSSSNHTVVFQLADWTDLGLTPKNLPPTLAPITSWQRQEAP